MKSIAGLLIAFIGIFLINLTVDGFGVLGNDIMHGTGLVIAMGGMYMVFKGRSHGGKEDMKQ
ncbi:hypothetical protein KP77_09630 [Jeotgalibacillus alimentarius]|uniref:Uncharacterized protein n=1 Tax=Jeotgalibacillus alimentarius TaxID=135826 RepID=A0A0C2W4C1_9BACL|nr:hypothetical protein [Jeotgalibacillus alimentarius]KIL51451.1 hypothetical protein KP77_09630 [Jeotgalibacillus alimentarius]